MNARDQPDRRAPKRVAWTNGNAPCRELMTRALARDVLRFQRMGTRESKGEGNREADRHYREKTEAFVESGRVPEAEAEARRAYDEDRADLEAAEATGKARSAGDDEHDVDAGPGDISDETAEGGHEHLSSRITELKSIRETLKLRMHLASKDAQDAFAAAEGKWNDLLTKAGMLKDTSKSSAQNILSATRLLADQIYESYQRLKNLV